jgi:2-polyprenyl-3-methyl-5-hydroxy-6-metoxy-1,4-benzoquinol methylase
MSDSNLDYRNYLFTPLDDRERQVVMHRICKPNFIKIMTKVLDEYGLAKQFDQAIRDHQKIKILDAGCGLGLYLYDVANILEERGYLAAANLFGIDKDETIIMTATEYAKLSKEPRTYLNYYLWDLNFPLADCQGLLVDKPGPVNFIYALALMEFLPNARQLVEKIYQELAPGGVIYLRSLITQEGPQGWIWHHPRTHSLFKTFFNMTQKANPGIEVATAQASWLKEAGAKNVQTFHHAIQSGGDSKDGIDLLRNNVILIRTFGQMMVDQGQLSQPDYNQMINELFQEIGPHFQGQTAWIDTLALKPME